MSAHRILLCLASVGLACGGEPAADETARDLSLAPAESVATLSDMPAEGTPAPTGTPATTPASPATPPSQPAAPPPSQPAAPPPTQRPTAATLVAAAGTVVMLAANDTLTSRHNKRGQTVTATLAADVTDARGRTVIPAGALFVGTITDIAPAESPGGQGRMVITYTSVEFGGKSYEVAARTDSIATHMKGRGITGGDAAKVGAATAVGAAAGAIIGKDAKGAVIGGAVGAAAGVGIAAATRDVDILLDAGAPIRLVLSAPFSVTVRG
jgi:hypothetical protein